MHALKPKLDEKDKKIIALVLNNPKISQKEIGDKVKLSTLSCIAVKAIPAKPVWCGY